MFDRSRWRQLGAVVALAGVAALAGVVACGPAAVVHRPGEEYVAGVELRGNHAIDDDTLIEGLALHRAELAGHGLDPYELSLDADRVRGLYARRGYFNADVRAAVSRRGSAATAVFTIDEGPRAPLVRVDLIGAPADPAVTPARLRERIPIGDGEPFDYDTYDDARPALLAALQDAGYARARLDAVVIADRVHHEAVIRIEIDPGPRCVFGPITTRGFDGDLAGLADAATARLAIVPGEPFSNRAVAASQDALYDMGRFATVRVEPDRAGDDAVIPVRISVVGAARHELRTGVGVGFDQLTYLARPHVGYSVAGWPWTMTTFDSDLRPAVALSRDPSTEQPLEPRLDALVSLSRLDLFRPRVKGVVSIGAQYLTVEAYASVVLPRLRLGLSSPLGRPELQISAGWQLAALAFANVNPALDVATRTRLRLDADFTRVSSFDQSLTVDFRDHPLEPRRGVYAALRVVEAATAIGSAYQYVQVTPDLRGYLPIGPVVLAAHARLGAILGGDAPATERYFAGGASSQRGFPERQLSPSVGGVVIGGAGLIETGVEARAAVAHLHGWPIEAAVFLDGGDVTERAVDLDPWHLHWAAGVGVRLVTAYGPVRLDFGYRLDRYGAGEPLPDHHRFAYQVGFGEAY